MSGYGKQAYDFEESLGRPHGPVEAPGSACGGTGSPWSSDAGGVSEEAAFAPMLDTRSVRGLGRRAFLGRGRRVAADPGLSAGAKSLFLCF